MLNYRGEKINVKIENSLKKKHISSMKRIWIDFIGKEEFKILLFISAHFHIQHTELNKYNEIYIEGDSKKSFVLEMVKEREYRGLAYI